MEKFENEKASNVNKDLSFHNVAFANLSIFSRYLGKDLQR